MIIKALLIDDELPILNNLQKVLPWRDLGIDIVGTARNGEQALAVVRDHRPDLILCDIRMPVMDGMDFLVNLRKLEVECEILMLTGYQEFEYVRFALRHGVRDYISKPINYEELEEKVSRSADLLRSRKQEQARTENRWGRAVHLAFEKMMFEQLMGYSSGGMNSILMGEEENPELYGYSVMLVDLDDYALKSAYWSESERKLWNFAVSNVLQDAVRETVPVSGEWRKAAVIQTREGEWCILIQLEPGFPQWETGQIRRWAGLIRQSVSANVKLAVSSALEAGPLAVQDLSAAYKRLQRQLFIPENDSKTDEDGEKTSETVKSHWNLIEDIVAGLKQKDQHKISRALASLQISLMALTRQSMVRAQTFMHYLIIHLLREMREIDIVSVKEAEEVWEKLAHSIGVKDLYYTLTQLVSRSNEVVMYKKSSEHLMQCAKDYIHRNLASDIGIDEVSDQLKISSSYFSLLFKNHFGETFVEYVTKQRMELAKSLLLKSDHSITKIGCMVGYVERRYFSKVFHRFTGVTPTEYRIQHQSIE